MPSTAKVDRFPVDPIPYRHESNRSQGLPEEPFRPEAPTGLPRWIEGAIYQWAQVFPETEGRQGMKIRPLQDRILVKRMEEEEKSSGGIIIPDSAKEKPQDGLVIAVGPGKMLDSGKISKPDVNKGDRILFSKYAGTDVNVDGAEHIIIREDDVLAVWE
jgi:chaperonin GroES